jgi:hypothetical protein
MSEPGSRVTVTLVDDATNEILGVADMAPEELPETFERPTTLHLDDADWSVIEAVPLTRAQYTQSGSLRLRLRRVEKVDPRKLLFSLPSICDYIPGLGDEPVSGADCLLAEDDWRQVELVSRSLASEADEEIEAIRRIHEEAKAEVGWREIHVRKHPEPPIVEELTLADIARVFHDEFVLAGVSYHGATTRIKDGYSLTTPDGLRLYGVVTDGRVTVVGIAGRPVASGSGSVECLATLAKEFDLDLVYWCRCARVAHDDPLFGRLLT